MKHEIIEHFEDRGVTGVTVMFTLDDEHTAHVDVRATEINGLAPDAKGEYTVRMYQKDGAQSSMDDTDDPHEAENYFRGFVKWDGCSHIYFGEADNSGYIHMCGGEAFARLSTVLQRVYNRCGELMAERGVTLLEDEFPAAAD